MKDFLIENYSFITKTFEIIAAITGLFLLNKYKQSTAKYFIYFLVYVAVIELIAGYPSYFAKYDFLSNFKEILKGTLFERNFWWYNIFWKIASALFYSFYFIKILKNRLYIKIIKFSCITFFLSSVIYIVLFWRELFSLTIVFNQLLGSAIILLCVILYFIEILQNDNILIFYKSINFYISAIILIWWLVTTPIVFYNIYFSTADWDFVILKWLIYLMMNIFMYTSFALALIFCKPENDINFRVKKM